MQKSRMGRLQDKSAADGEQGCRLLGSTTDDNSEKSFVSDAGPVQY